MTEIEKKTIRVMLDEQKRRQAPKIAARHAADPKGTLPEDLTAPKPISLYLIERVDEERIEIRGKYPTIREATQIALAEISEHAGGAGIAAYDYAYALFCLLFKELNRQGRERLAKGLPG